jgi:cyclopropane-fatty-acyl-phospholipid synthase
MWNAMTRAGTSLMERGLLPDALVRRGIRGLCAQRLREEDAGGDEAQRESLRRFIALMDAGPIAPVPEKANEQHYELPAAFFELVLGRHCKYSSCLWSDGVASLDEAEELALAATCEHADLRDGQEVLELGCGWGSLSLWMGERFPGSRIVAVSNSAPQRAFIEARAAQRGLANVSVITRDMNAFQTDLRFDRIISVEMFEHMRNWRALLRRAASWLRPDGMMLLHVFVHRRFAYEFDTQGAANWLGRHFFTGGIMPSEDLPLHVADGLRVIERWHWPGTHYQRTANAWLANLDARRSDAMKTLAACYGTAQARRWLHRWRVFFMACAELWGYAGGDEWGVSHYRLAKRPGALSTADQRA